MDGPGGSKQNEGECSAVLAHVSALLLAGVRPEGIAVQAPYGAQVELLRSRLASVPGAEKVEVASVDSFQGREADAVVISMVRSNDKGSVGFLTDQRRMNVAVTRARCQVVRGSLLFFESPVSICCCLVCLPSRLLRLRGCRRPTSVSVLLARRRSSATRSRLGRTRT